MRWSGDWRLRHSRRGDRVGQPVRFLRIMRKDTGDRIGRPYTLRLIYHIWYNNYYVVIIRAFKSLFSPPSAGTEKYDDYTMNFEQIHGIINYRR